MYSDNSAEEFLEFSPLLELPLEPVSRRQREITPFFMLRDPVYILRITEFQDWKRFLEIS